MLEEQEQVDWLEECSLVDEVWLCHGDGTWEALDGSQIGWCTYFVMDSSYVVDDELEEEVGDVRNDDGHDEVLDTGNEEEDGVWELEEEFDALYDA